MKYVTISTLKPGIDNAKKALEVFTIVGNAEGTETLLAGIDGKTFVNIVESDDPDLATAMTYAPFFESVTVIPVAEVDDKWMAAIQKAVVAWG